MVDNIATHAEDVARTYYDTSDVDDFYTHAWGGEDIHVGVYAGERESIVVASRRTIDCLAGKVAEALAPGRTVLDMGAGYGGAARAVAASYGCRVTALNISEVQNRRHREINADRGLDGLIDVVTGSFNDIPAPEASFDVVWSQDALCHSGDRSICLREAARVLRPGGHLVFTDFMAADDTIADQLRPIVERLTAPDLATPDFYSTQLRHLPLTNVEFDDLTDHMLTHYERLTEVVQQADTSLADTVSATYLQRLRENIPLWVDACRNDRFRWGIFHARRT